VLAGKPPDQLRAGGVLARSKRSPANRSRSAALRRVESSDRRQSPRLDDDSSLLDRNLGLNSSHRVVHERVGGVTWHSHRQQTATRRNQLGRARESPRSAS
jgi:hypothetical protein